MSSKLNNQIRDAYYTLKQDMKKIEDHIDIYVPNVRSRRELETLKEILHSQFYLIQQELETISSFMREQEMKAVVKK